MRELSNVYSKLVLVWHLWRLWEQILSFLRISDCSNWGIKLCLLRLQLLWKNNQGEDLLLIYFILLYSSLIFSLRDSFPWQNIPSLLFWGIWRADGRMEPIAFFSLLRFCTYKKSRESPTAIRLYHIRAHYAIKRVNRKFPVGRHNLLLLSPESFSAVSFTW